MYRGIIKQYSPLTCHDTGLKGTELRRRERLVESMRSIPLEVVRRVIIDIRTAQIPVGPWEGTQGKH